VPVYVKKLAFLRVPLPRLALRVVRARRKLRALIWGRIGGGLGALCFVAKWWVCELGAMAPDAGLVSLAG
jgi:hypothetical protein